MKRAALLTVGLLLTGCPKDQAPPPDDRLLEKLQAEKNRLARGGEPTRPALPAATGEPSPLAARAAMPDSPKTLAIVGPPEFMVGKASLRISGVETSHNISGGKTALTTDDYFFKVTLTGHFAGGGTIDLSAAKLVQGADEYPIARDAQSLAGTRQLTRVLKPDEKMETVLLFEAPGSAIAPGLKLVVAGGDGVSLQ